jgi:hypothetical protein
MESLDRSGWAVAGGWLAVTAALIRLAGDPPLSERACSEGSERFKRQESWWCGVSDKKVFVSYDYDNDKDYKNLLAAWDANARFDFTWDDHSTPKINSNDAAYIKSVIAAKMAKADSLLVIVGEETAQSVWVDWEIRKAKELGLSLVGVKLAKTNTSPSALLDCGASWALSFSQDAVVTALDAC